MTNLTQDMKNAEKAGNSLGKELTQVNRLLKMDPGNVVLVKQKQDLLAKSISTAKDKLKEMEAAQKQVEDQFKNGEIDGGQYRSFQRELEKTKQNLQALEKEQKSVTGLGGAFNQVKVKIGEASEKLASLLSGLQKVGSVTAAGVEVGKKALVAYATAAIAAGTAIVAMTTKAAAWSDEVNTLAAQTGLSTDEIQRFQYATEHIDVSLDTLTGSMAKLTKNMANASKGTGDAANAFKQLGVEIVDENGILRDNQDVFNEAIGALGEMEDATQRDAYAMQIFGKSAQDLNPLILGGADALQVLGDQADEAGLILGQDAVDNLNAFNDSIDTMKANATAGSRVLSGVFAAGFQNVTDVVGAEIPNIVHSMAELFSGGDMAGAQENLTTSFTAIVTGALETLGSALPGFLAAFNAVILSIVGAVGKGLPNIIKTVLPALVQGVVGLIQALVAQVPTVVPLLVQAGFTLFLGLLDGLNETIPMVVEMIPGLVQQVVDILVANLPLLINGAFQLFIGLTLGIAQSMPEIINAVIALIPVIVDSLMANLPLLIEAGMQILVAVIGGIVQAIPQLVAMLPEIITSIVDGLKGGFAAIVEVGKGIVEGIWEGIQNMASWLWDQVTSFCSGILDNILSFFGINSPSTLMRDQVGRYMAEGIGVGFVGTMKKVTKDMQAAIPSDFGATLAVNSQSGDPGQNSSSSAGPAAFNQTVNIYSPTQPTAADTARQTRNAAKQLLLQVVPT